MNVVGIMLVSYSSRGHQLVFSYPDDRKRFNGKTDNGQSSETFLGIDVRFISDILSPKVTLCDRAFELTIDDITFLGQATLLNADRPGTGNIHARAIQKRRSKNLEETQLTMFNLVIATDSSACLNSMFGHVVTKITAALKYEQLKRNYVRSETELILMIKEQSTFFYIFSTKGILEWVGIHL